MLNRPYAFGCILRLRTSTEFGLSHSVCDPAQTIFELHNWHFMFRKFLEMDAG